MVFYDINCQYSVHFRDRVKLTKSLHFPEDVTLVPAIGQFHVHGHKDSCFARYSPSLIPGAGEVEGEIVETLWSNLNDLASSTRGMSIAHRDELLDCHMNDSNFKKMIGIGRRLLSIHGVLT